ncbi:MAG: uridine kinase, partial [Deltaproteobacteria bacterium]|nr:uridine kinase [Deltaproteobacteria bacterium]
MPKEPHIIGVAGPSCSGKSEIARRLIKKFGEMNSVILTLDSYYHDLSPLDPAEREAQNFDVPEALDHDLLRQQLLAVASGSAIEKPLYDFATHTRSPQSERIVPGETVIIEGLFAL